VTRAGTGFNLADVAKLFFLPGDTFIFALSTYAAPVARLLGISAADYGGVLAAFVSTCVWLAAFIALSIAYHSVLDFDRRATAGARRLAASALRHARMTRAVLRQRWRAWRAARGPANEIDFPGDIDLTATQRQALRLHAELGPGYALSVTEAARALGARRSATQDLLDGLQALGLLNRTLGGADGESAYTLSAAGKALLLFRQLNDGDRSRR
jgi:DNA-binding MarR family transcriptional regulator